MDKKYCYKYPHPAVSVDCIVVCRDDDNNVRVLLIKRKNDPYKDCWAFPGGFVEMQESAEEAVRRELQEETTIAGIKEFHQFHTYSEPDRDPRERVITIVFWALAETELNVKGEDDAAEARWFPLSSLPPLAFDHQKIIDEFLQSSPFITKEL